jgi:hypothetical protein
MSSEGCADRFSLTWAFRSQFRACWVRSAQKESSEVDLLLARAMAQLSMYVCTLANRPGVESVYIICVNRR